MRTEKHVSLGRPWNWNNSFFRVFWWSWKYSESSSLFTECVSQLEKLIYVGLSHDKVYKMETKTNKKLFKIFKKLGKFHLIFSSQKARTFGFWRKKVTEEFGSAKLQNLLFAVQQFLFVKVLSLIFWNCTLLLTLFNFWIFKSICFSFYLIV